MRSMAISSCLRQKKVLPACLPAAGEKTTALPLNASCDSAIPDEVTETGIKVGCARYDFKGSLDRWVVKQSSEAAEPRGPPRGEPILLPRPPRLRPWWCNRELSSAVRSGGSRESRRGTVALRWC